MKRKNLEVMATFSHPVRVEMMRLLSRRKMTVNELAKELPLTSGGVRPHLSYFINRKLLHTKRNGRTVHYWLNRERLVEALSEFGDAAGLEVGLVKRWTVEDSREGASDETAKKKARKKTAKKKTAKKKTAKKKAAPKKTTKKRRPTKKTVAKKTASKRAASRRRKARR